MSKKPNLSKELFDPEFGTILIASGRTSSRLSLRLDKTGRLKITTPRWYSTNQVADFIDASRSDIRKFLQKAPKPRIYRNGEVIGKNHLLKVIQGQDLTSHRIALRPNHLVVELALDQNIEDADIQTDIRQFVIKILRQQARHYLPERLKYWANKYGFNYERVRLSHATTRWGSCSNKRTISLNIALMTLPNKLIDYVIVHELCHLIQLNHSKLFWAEVAKIMPDYKKYEKELKNYTSIV